MVADKAQAICDYYTVVSKQPAKEPSTFYKRKCWAPPAAWNDIDDPDDQPEGIRPSTPVPRGKLTPKLIGQLEAIINHYGSLAAAARALSISTGLLSSLSTGRAETIDVHTRARVYTKYARLFGKSNNHTTTRKALPCHNNSHCSPRLRTPTTQKSPSTTGGTPPRTEH